MMNPQDELPEQMKMCPACYGDGTVENLECENEACDTCGGIGEVYEDEAANDAAQHHWEGKREDKG